MQASWHGETSLCNPGPQREAPVFFVFRAGGLQFAAIGCLRGPAEEGWICICTSTDRASTDTFRPVTDIPTIRRRYLFRVFYLPTHALPSPIIIGCQGWCECIL